MKRKILSFLVMITMLLSIVVNVEALTTAGGSHADKVIKITDLHTQVTDGNHYSIRDYNGNIIISNSTGFGNGIGAGVIRYKDSEGNSIFCAELGTEYGGGKTSTSQQVYNGTGPACGIVKSMYGNYAKKDTADAKKEAANKGDYKYIVGEVLSGETKEATNKKWEVDNIITLNDFSKFSTDDLSYVRIQRAIWKYQNYTGDCKDVDGNVINDYREYEHNDLFNFNFKNTEKVVALSSDGKYYETTFSFKNLGEKASLFTVPLEAIVEAPVVSEKISNLEFKIKVPVEKFVNGMQVNLTITGKYESSKYDKYTPVVTVYEINNGENQDMATVSLIEETDIKEYKDINSTSQIKLVLPTGSIELVKSDANNAAKIQGAKFQLYVKKGTEYVAATDYNGKVIPELITDVNGKIVVSNLPYGSYKLEETAAAVGYVYDKENHYSQLFTLDANNKTFTDEVTNESIKIIISKKDVANEKEVEGAKIVVYEYDTTKKEIGEVVKEFVSSKTATQFYIEPGVYALKETVAPESYKKVETTFIFEVTQDRNVKLLDTYSEKDIKTSKNIITLYNEVEPVIIPDVPDTGSSIKILFIVLGSLLLVAGSAIIYFTLKRKSAQSI